MHLTTVRAACDLRTTDAAMASLKEEVAAKEVRFAEAAATFTEEAERDPDILIAPGIRRLAPKEGVLHTVVVVLGTAPLRATTLPVVTAPTAFNIVACILRGVRWIYDVRAYPLSEKPRFSFVVQSRRARGVKSELRAHTLPPGKTKKKQIL